jgi:rod shape determining protein RodA
VAYPSLVPRTGPDRSRHDLSAPARHVDVVLIVCTFALASLGVLMVYSATRGSEAPYDRSFLQRQALFLVGGAVAMVVTTAIDYRRLRDFAWIIYGGTIVLLLGVLSPLGVHVNGAQAWFSFGIFQLQPAEFAKLAVILAVASLIAHWSGEIDLRRLGILGALTGAPMFLILLQPDLGSMLVLVAITIGMLLVGGLRGRYILALSAIGLVGLVVVFSSSLLAEYQKDRLTVFLEDVPQEATRDRLDAHLNVDRSKTAIGNGRITGEGLFQGTQTQLGFVPEQQTDFIFTAVGEELGFVGGATVLGLYGVLVWRIWRAAQLARDRLGTLLCVGVLSMLVFHIFENVGMAMGIMPVTGIPLPLLSYGGSSTLTTFIAIGLVLNVHMRRFR